MTMREAFERHFPVPDRVEFDATINEYVFELVRMPAFDYNESWRAWQAAIEHVKQGAGGKYSDIVSDGGMDPR